MFCKNDSILLSQNLKTKIKIRQVLDIAEIPTFQLQGEIDTDKNGTLSAEELNAYAKLITPEHLANLSLTVNDQPLDIRAESTNISLQTGAGNLPTVRIEWNLASDLGNLSELIESLDEEIDKFVNIEDE